MPRENQDYSIALRSKYSPGLETATFALFVGLFNARSLSSWILWALPLKNWACCWSMSNAFGGPGLRDKSSGARSTIQVGTQENQYKLN